MTAKNNLRAEKEIDEESDDSKDPKEEMRQQVESAYFSNINQA